ncbi:MAG: GTP cyclohydrolase I FolE, partial [Chloroflexi bacterium]|nr:GTP cyclohydrolase I FolE [Chloroflexota bacterium]
RMTQEIASFLDSLIDPKGVDLVVQRNKKCTVMRGVRKQDPRMVTSAVMGSLRDNAATRDEFMEHLRNTSV